MNGQTASNPLLPSWEYVPDGEPHVFGDRVYLYGSHDRFGGKSFCEGDYVVWSAPLRDLGNWTFHGVSFRKDQDPDNAEGHMRLYAPDVAQGGDGRFYLYYFFEGHSRIGVAVADGPAGPFEFLGHVRDSAGNLLGMRPGDTEPFDPAVLVDGERVWLYSGNGPIRRGQDLKRKKASVVMELETDMLTLRSEPKTLIPTLHNGKGTSFANHEFFEASSARKFGDIYYVFYSSVKSHELCWASASRPDGPYEYGGTLISNGDIGLTDASSPRNYIGNDHGSVIDLGGKYAVFHHRHTNRQMFSRQACAEFVHMDGGGRFLQAELTTSGLHDGPLPAVGRYEARTACHLSSANGAGWAHPLVQTKKHPAFTQTLPDREDRPDQHIENLRQGATAGFRYFHFDGPGKFRVTTRGKGEGKVVVRDGQEGRILGSIDIHASSDWTQSYVAPLEATSDTSALYFTYMGASAIDFMEFELL